MGSVSLGGAVGTPAMQLIEPEGCHDIFCNGIGRVEMLSGGCVRVVMYVEHRLPNGLTEYVVACKLIRPISTLWSGKKLLDIAIGGEAISNRH